MLSENWLRTKVKTFLEIDDTNAYDDKFTIVIKGAISKLATEGVKNIYSENDLTDEAYDYLLCVAYQVAQDFNLITAYAKLDTQYTTRVNQLRLRQASNNEL